MIRRAVLEELEALACSFTFFFLIARRFQGALLPFDRLFEVAGLRVRHTQRGKEVGRFPGSQLAGLGGILERGRTVANVLFRAVRQQPGEAAVGVCILGVKTKDLPKVADSLTICASGLMRVSAIEVG